MFHLKIIVVLSFLFGITSRLYLKTMFGYVGMFDIFCYVLGPMLFFKMATRLTRREHGVLLLILFWVLGSLIVNLANGFPTQIALKAVGVTFSIWCMSVVCLWMLRANPRTALFYIIGTYFGAVIGLYVFQNGALLEYAAKRGFESGYLGEFLLEKQIMPTWVSFFCISGGMTLLLLWKRLPRWLMPTAFVASGFYLLFKSGSRSTFGLYFAVGIVSFGMAYCRSLVKSLFNNLPIFLGLSIIFALLVFGTYGHLAKKGALGDDEQYKFEHQFIDEEGGLSENISVRGGYRQTWQDFMRKPFGSGGVGAIRHSAISDTVYKEGLFGIPFWIYFIGVVFYFLRKHLLKFEQWTPFIAMVILSFIWNAFASPFGGRGTYCFALSLAVLSKEPAFMHYWRVCNTAGARSGNAPPSFRYTA